MSFIMKRLEKTQQLGILGAGKIGSAIIHSLTKSSIYKELQIHLYDTKIQTTNTWDNQENIQVYQKDQSILNAEYPLLICVKPNTVFPILKKIKSKRLIISIAAGVSLSQIQEGLSQPSPIVRAMPNIPLQVQQGYTVLCCNQHTSKEESLFAKSIFSSGGIARLIDDENLIDAFTAISGSGPAYVFSFIQAMEDAAVLLGISRDLAREAAHATIYGAITLSKKHIDKVSPQDLIHQVTSPGGTTIHALQTLQKNGFTTSVIEAAKTAYQTSKEISS